MMCTHRHTQNFTMSLCKENVVFEFEYKVCRLSAYHVCLINMLFGYIFKLLCNIKVCALMWYILSRLNPIFLHFLVKIQFCLKKRDTSKLYFLSVFLIFCSSFVDINNGYGQVTMLILPSEERFRPQRKIYTIHETS